MLGMCGFNVNHWLNKAGSNPVVSSFSIKSDGNNLTVMIVVPKTTCGKSIMPDDLSSILRRLNREYVVILNSQTDLVTEFEARIICSGDRQQTATDLMMVANALSTAMQIIDTYRLSV